MIACFQFSMRLLAWEAWAGSSLGDKVAWETWAAANGGWSLRETPLAPVTAMPALLRRRMDASDRLALEVAYRLRNPGEEIPGVFASRHGQVTRSVAMLEAQVAGEPASPMDFSLSVHNAVAGQFSIAAGDRSPSSSLSSRGETLGAALLEAQGMIAEGREAALAVISDPVPPEIYRGRWREEPAGYALGLRLGAAGGEEIALSLEADAEGTDSPLPQALAFLRFLAGKKKSGSWQRGARRWAWSRS